MRLLKLTFITIVSLFIFAACSNDSKSVAGRRSTVEQKPIPKDPTDRTKNDDILKTYQTAVSDIQLLTVPGVVDAQCSEVQIQNALDNESLLQTLLANNATEENISLAINQITSRASTQSCQLLALNRAAQEATNKFGSAINDAHTDSPDLTTVERSSEQLILITSVIGPKINEIRQKINNDNREYFRNAVAYYDKIRDSLKTEILTSQAAVQTAEHIVNGCPLSASECAEKYENLKKLLALNKDILAQTREPASLLQSTNETDPQLKQKLEEAQNLVVVVVVGRVLLENATNSISAGEITPPGTP